MESYRKSSKKAGVNPSEIIAITGHKNQQVLKDYDELDTDDHQCIGKVLSYIWQNTQISVASNCTLDCSFPVFNTQNCKVVINTPSYESPAAPKKIEIESDGDRD